MRIIPTATFCNLQFVIATSLPNTAADVAQLRKDFEELKLDIEDILHDQNDINQQQDETNNEIAIQIEAINDALDQLREKPSTPRKRIGYKTGKPTD